MHPCGTSSQRHPGLQEGERWQQLREVTLLCSALVGHVRSTGTRSGLPSAREVWTNWSGPSEGP